MKVKKNLLKSVISLLITLTLFSTLFVSSTALYYSGNIFSGTQSTAVTHVNSDYNLNLTQSPGWWEQGKFTLTITPETGAFGNFTATVCGDYYRYDDYYLDTGTDTATGYKSPCYTYVNWTEDAHDGNLFQAQFYVISNSTFTDNWYVSEYWICEYDSSRHQYGWKIWQE